MERQLAEGQAPQPIVNATIEAVIQAYKDYLVGEGRSKKTKAKYWSVLSRVKDLADTSGKSIILHIDLAFVDKYRAKRAKTCQPKTVYNESVILRQLVKFAFTRRMVSIDPLVGLKLKKPKPTPQPYFDDAQIDQILAAARAPHADTFLLLAETGLRIGEAKWLAWNDVDLVANVIHVRAKPGWRPKTGDERAIPISPKLQKLFERRPRRGRWVLTALPTTTRPATDRQIDEGTALKSLQRVLTRLKLTGKLHSFRHSFVSRCCTRGIEESVIRSWVGHIDRSIMQLYTPISSQISQDRIRRLSESDRSDDSDGTGPKS